MHLVNTWAAARHFNMQRVGHKSEKWELSGLEQLCKLLMVGVLIRWW